MPTDGAAALDTSFDAIAGWCNNQMPSYNVSNIGSDWKDGVALLALFDGLKPDLGLVDMPSLDPNNAEENIRRGLELFEDHFGLIQFVDVETIMQCDGTELMQCMYVYLIELQRLVDELEPGVDQPVQEDLIRDMEQQLNMSYEISTRDRAESIESIEWVWSSFHPGGEALSEEEKNEQAAKLMRRLDANEDGFMSFDEFNGWFRKTCASIERYRRARAPNKATTRSTATTHRTRRRTTSASKEPSSTAGTQPAVRVPASIAPVVSKPKPVLEPVKGSVSESESEEYSTEYSESSSGADYEAGQDLFQPVGYLATIMKLAAKRKQLRQRAKGCGKMFVPLNKYNERQGIIDAVSYTHLRAHETPEHLVCRLLLEKKKKKNQTYIHLT
eukprot:TRINITY_DN5637_c0_g1_i1.p1 TRINITY_DN5637_c0_g1~~TRINITY_DN5637_c0_g1_i1.p1  ORF type:complete len:387 (-),score=99.14 TRINITY_DN5637_c0_g1_i1:62-1222(-)